MSNLEEPGAQESFRSHSRATKRPQPYLRKLVSRLLGRQRLACVLQLGTQLRSLLRRGSGLLVGTILELDVSLLRQKTTPSWCHRLRAPHTYQNEHLARH